MTDSLSTSEIKKRSIKGAKWLLVMNALGIPSALLIALMLGRVGPAALGIYALAQIFIGVITTFVVYGGSPVLSVFLPTLSCAKDRGRFLFSYALILLAMMALTLSLFWLFPRALEFLLHRDFDMHNYGWFLLLAIVVVMTEMIVNTASGLMLIKPVAIARQMMRMILLPIVGVLYLFKREILIDYGMACILGGFLGGYILSAVICMVSVTGDDRFQIRPGWLLPNGFWGLSLSMMASTILTFLYNNFDRIAVLSINDVEGLGMYQAVISLSMLIGLVPTILGATLVPMFSSLMATGNNDAVKKAYDLLQRTGSFLMTWSALFLISYSGELLSLFGPSYSTYDYLLSLFCVQAVITSLRFGNTPILIAYQKNSFRVKVSIFQILTQIVLTLLFVQFYGVMAIALSKIIGVISANILNVFYVTKKISKNFLIPSCYKVGIAISLVCAIVRIYFLPDGWLISTVVFMIFTGSFFIGSKISVDDINRIIAFGFPRKTLSKFKTGN